MAIKKDYLRNLLKVMGFYLLNGTDEVWEKSYKNHENYIIKIDFANESIIYDNSETKNTVIVSNKTTSNLSLAENLVVLECVDRLLEIGYKPNCIELEHSWSSGHNTSGRLDILVYKNLKPYMMIECKTFGQEFKKEKENMLLTKKVGNEYQPKGQLFSYFFQEKTTEYLCLYSSVLQNGLIVFENAIIPIEEKWKIAVNQREVFEHWNKNFKTNGIFERSAIPYNIKCKALMRSDLEKITDEDSSRIFNQFLEILRHNAVSDKPNAFNKILNLFICKIIDEDRNYNEELKFQWKDDSTYISLLSDLEDLYKHGMIKYLDIEVTDYSDSEIEKKLNLMDNNSAKTEIKKMFQELRLQKNPEFAFKEVFNKESFEDNAKVVKEVVQLLQGFQFRYGHKQQFLGNFFELLLNTSIKQESGQFFTPVPIAKFMISSLPLKEKIDLNIASNSKDILPKVIDYACGSGHFLTEYMDIMQNIINMYNTDGLKKSIKNTIEKWKQSDNEEELQGEFEWAKDYVYGIEKDYRLVKTTKISTFLNGDGEAVIIHADGLDKFSSQKYRGALCSAKNKNENFDFIVANPPYSVSAFKQSLPSNKDDFEMYDILTNNSSEIECLFIERTMQLLKENGCASIILPSSILTNTSLISQKAREFIIKNFYIKAIAKMGSNTFMATGTNTVIMFLQKRPENDFITAESVVNLFFVTYKDFSYNGISEVISKYIKENVDEELLYNDYVSLLKKDLNTTIINSIFYKDCYNSFLNSKEYKDVFKKTFFKKLSTSDKKLYIENLFYTFFENGEKKKLLYYLLTFTEKTLIIKTGEKDDEKQFLGYEFSNRRGSEGIHYFKDDNGNIDSQLYDDDDINENPKKVNYYINKAFKGEYPAIPDDLLGNIKVFKTNQLLRINNIPFDLNITLTPNFKINFESRYEKIALKEICSIQKGTTITEKETSKGSIPVIAGGKKAAYYHNVSNRKENIITVSASGAYSGFVNYWNEPIFASDCTTIKSNDETIVLTKYIYILLTQKQDDLYMLQKGQGQPHVYPDDLGNIYIPVPPLSVQELIVSDYFGNLKDLEIENKNIENNKIKIGSITDQMFLNGHKTIKMSEISTISRGASPRPIKKYLTNSENGVNWIKIGDTKIGEKYITTTKQKITQDGAKKSVFVKKGDFIISNSMSFGRPYIIDTEGCIHDGWLLIGNISKNISLDCLYYMLLSDSVQNQFKERANGSTVANLNIDRVKQVSILDLTLDEQKIFIDKIDDINFKINASEKIINEIYQKLNNILNSYLI